MITKLELFKNVIYYMQRSQDFPELDFWDMVFMWEALMKKWDIKIDHYKWEQFLIEIEFDNVIDYIRFSKLFNKYFYE